MSTITAIILAAGKGSRMKSNQPKVLHPIGGKPMLAHVLAAAQNAGADELRVVYGHGGDQVVAELDRMAQQLGTQARHYEQTEQLGTGHAVKAALPELAEGIHVLVLYGDVPLTTPETLRSLLEPVVQERSSLAVLSAQLGDPTGYGRMVRNDEGSIERIVEQKDATGAELAINEVNTGMMALRSEDLIRWLDNLSNDNAQGEYYLTDVVEMAVSEGKTVVGVLADNPVEVAGVNDRAQQAELERAYQAIQASALMEAGATLLDPARIDIRGNVAVGRDVMIDVNCVFEGEVVLGDNVTIAPNCVIKNAEIGAGCAIKENTSIDTAFIEKDVQIGPFARVRPGTQLAAGTKIGNFVETKNAHIGKGSKVNHLSYVGDATVGQETNIGAGTITANYDGVNKHRTEIADDVSVGSGTMLVAPVTIGAGATIGAGSVITQDVQGESLALGRARQTGIDGWQRPKKK